MNHPETLPNDIARCNGVQHGGLGRDCCETCLRRTAPRPERVVMMAPPKLLDNECPYRIPTTHTEVAP